MVDQTEWTRSTRSLPQADTASEPTLRVPHDPAGERTSLRSANAPSISDGTAEHNRVRPGGETNFPSRSHLAAELKPRRAPPQNPPARSPPRPRTKRGLADAPPWVGRP